MFARQPRPQALCGKKRHGGETGGGGDDGSEALREAPLDCLFVCINPTMPCEPRSINPITQNVSRSTKERRLGTRQFARAFAICIITPNNFFLNPKLSP